ATDADACQRAELGRREGRADLRSLGEGRVCRSTVPGEHRVQARAVPEVAVLHELLATRVEQPFRAFDPPVPPRQLAPAEQTAGQPGRAAGGARDVAVAQPEVVRELPSLLALGAFADERGRDRETPEVDTVELTIAGGRRQLLECVAPGPSVECLPARLD